MSDQVENDNTLGDDFIVRRRTARMSTGPRVQLLRREQTALDYYPVFYRASDLMRAQDQSEEDE